MAKTAILILSSPDDPHVHDVVSELRSMNCEPVLLDTDDIPLGTTLTLGLAAGRPAWRSEILLQRAGLRLDPGEIRSVWWRRPGKYFGLPDDLSVQEREFARWEIRQVMRGLWATLDCYWLSYPERIRQADVKIEQLQRAASLGFDVPATLVTNDPDAVRSFYAEHRGNIVFKALTDPFLGMTSMAEKYPEESPHHAEPHELPTTRITEAEMAHMESVRLVPSLFQEYVPKRLELRVTIIGDELFAAEIHSQERAGTSVDWRNWADGGLEITYRKATLPADVAERCMTLVRGYGLNFSAIDLILTPDGRYVFLENNPNGQFIWVEKLVPELRMTAALASCLARGANC
ncbi:MvdC/MvdD family ATP grasp protein [Nonomuraea typhae]|uniref:MvdC/MvdD family ATP grasp protein n=1 Tax=Nonomuraea typhae TaxID=2603600 RepID=A0ABW7YPW3_9ACTN